MIAANTTAKDVLVAVLFATKQSNGLILWYGQNRGEAFHGQDFIALALNDGYLEFAFRLNNEETIVRNTFVRANDGARHIAVVKRNGNLATLELDTLQSFGESRPTAKDESYLPGNLFIGEHKLACFLFLFNLQRLITIQFNQVVYRT